MEEENVKAMVLIIVSGFSSLILSVLTVMASTSGFEFLSFISNNLVLFSFLSIGLFLFTVKLDRVFNSGLPVRKKISVIEVERFEQQDLKPQISIMNRDAA